MSRAPAAAHPAGQVDGDEGAHDHPDGQDQHVRPELVGHGAVHQQHVVGLQGRGGSKLGRVCLVASVGIAGGASQGPPL